MFSRRPLTFALATALGALAVPLSLSAGLYLEEVHQNLSDFDHRVGVVDPTPEALALVESLNGVVRWNRFGTVHVLFSAGGFLAYGLPGGDPEDVARTWISDNRSLFGLSSEGVDSLTVERVAHLQGSSAVVVELVQRADGVPVMYDGRIKIGLVDGNLFWVSSTSIGDPGSLSAASLTATEAWLEAATGLGMPVTLGDIDTPTTDGSWQTFSVSGLSGLQRSRLVALGIPGQGAIPAFETVVMDQSHGGLIGYTTFVDASSGARLVGRNRVQQSMGEEDEEPVETPAQVEAFNGSYPPNQVGTCGPCEGPFTAEPADAWDELAVTVHHLAGGDITFKVFFNDPSCSGAPILDQDLLTTPERASITPIEPGDYFVQVCPFDATTNLLSGDYAGVASFQNELTPNQNPQWVHFPAYPSPDFASVDTRVHGCWFDTDSQGNPLPLCETELAAGSSHGITWDFVPAIGASSETTTGNAARSSEARDAFLSGGGPYQPVVSSTDPEDHRVYDFPWTNQWFESACDPTVLTLSGGLEPDADIDAAITNLFVLHNQVHDWAYHLGLREREGAAQLSNFGTTSAVEESDFELGNAQAGALTGGWPSYTGRDNANQLTLNDGIPPLSNMYLWQTIGGAIYVPCVDGDFDAGVIGHEYGHLIQNRMVDPQNGLGGRQGRAMGESWSDLTAVEFLNEYGRVPVANENPFAVGAYITDPETGIRNYAMNDSPLNFSNVGYDIVCESDTVTGECISVMQVHADGEIWSAVNFDIREALRAKYDAGFPSSDTVLQKRCADGQVPADMCPGNRRFAQIMHDAFLLVPNSPTMVDARDAYLAADLARAGDPILDWPSNQAELWQAFARRGFGVDAFAADGSDFDPTPSFESPLGGIGSLTFNLTSVETGSLVVGQVFAGQYEARSTPVADTDPGTALGPTHAFVPGTYDFVARADGYGHFRFQVEVGAGDDRQVEVRMPTNWASAAGGASAAGLGEDLSELIDDTEATNWQRTAAVPSVDEERPTVTVNLPGAQAINRVQVSGMLEVLLGENLQNRFTSVHGFRVLACNGALLNCGLDLNYTTILDAPDAFPSADLRALVKDASIRSFPTEPVTATHLRFQVLHNKCTGTPKYQGYLGIPGNDDADPNNGTDCRLGSPPLVGPKNVDVRAAEFQAFGAGGEVVIDGGEELTLLASGHKVHGLQKADLSWSGAVSTDVDIVRDGSVIATTDNDGFYTDDIDNRGPGSYTYQVCETGTTTCSNEAVVSF